MYSKAAYFAQHGLRSVQHSMHGRQCSPVLKHCSEPEPVALDTVHRHRVTIYHHYTMSLRPTSRDVSAGKWEVMPVTDGVSCGCKRAAESYA